MGALGQSLMNSLWRVMPAKQRDDKEKSVEFSMRVSLNNRLKFAKERFNEITAEEKR